MSLSTPVAFLIFNRPDTTANVFEEIRRAQPPKLLVVADGPRPDRSGEAERCSAARAIIESVDWPCEVLKNYSDVNLGCKGRVSSGLDWVFDTVEEAIILEDDCLPHPTFFLFCEELLDRYRNDERIAQINGTNYQFGRRRTYDSYYFSIYSHIWGWASWRRAWGNYDVGMRLWPVVRDGDWMRDVFSNSKFARYWITHFEKVYKGEINTWDYQWFFTNCIHNKLSIIPNVNLISNIGFTADATHTIKVNLQLAAMKVQAMNFPLQHPDFMIRDTHADDFTQNEIFARGLKQKIKRFCAG